MNTKPHKATPHLAKRGNVSDTEQIILVTAIPILQIVPPMASEPHSDPSALGPKTEETSPTATAHISHPPNYLLIVIAVIVGVVLVATVAAAMAVS